MRRLILFDIDETMVASDGAGRRAIELAISKVFNVEADSSGLSMSGKTDPQICHEILSALGYTPEEINERLSELFQVYVEILAGEIKKAREFRLHAGVSDLLAVLEQSPWAYLGLLTGNIEPGARLKLAPFSLNKFFKVGAFGCDSHNRLDLPEVAHRRASEYFEQDFSPSEMVIIGDAVNDILCARGYGVPCIAVATGKTPKNVLSDLSPEFLFDTLGDTNAVLTAIRLGR